MLLPKMANISNLGFCIIRIHIVFIDPKLKAKSWLHKYSEESHKLLKILANLIIDYLVEQLCAGAQVILKEMKLCKY